ncbi:hypothetical protein CAQU_07495 [Corynebacterium aquilae DSM 44791]|uniref:Cobalt ABC transporter permease n=1 Tax=Corynebacterium aquilae DSM 44791 TaxID=1431546 RepID=A0A1L7CGI3_9CORY|nr:hypothetical protein CAQU_07495 [Corynebacterium aquilae DSM 44791]
MVDNAMLGTYIPGSSPLHRMPPGAKMLGLIAFIIATTLIAKTPPVALGCCVIALAGYAMAKIPARTAIAQLLPPLPVLAVLSLVTGIFDSWAKAIAIFFSVYASIIAATLVTLTTTIANMLDALERALSPLSKLGLPVEAITLVLVLTIRMIPVQLQAIAEAIDAAKARGAGLSLTAVIVPVIIRSIRCSAMLGDALTARGIGDD